MLLVNLDLSAQFDFILVLNNKRKFTPAEFSARFLSKPITVPSIFPDLGSSRFGNDGKLGCLVYLSGAQCTSLVIIKL